MSVCLPDASEPGHATLRAHFPPGYPSRVPPVIEIDWGRAAERGVDEASSASGLSSVRREALERLAWDLEEEWRPGGDVTLFDWCQRALDAWREACDELDAQEAQTSTRQSETDAEKNSLEPSRGEALGRWRHGGGESEKGRSSATSSVTPADDTTSSSATAPLMISSDPVTIMRSTFQAHAARVRSPAEATAAVDALLASSAKIRAATHNVMAYRVRASTATAAAAAFACDWDDDGESAAGRRLAHLLAASDSEDVVLVVTRWYGGIHMGPLRFAVFANVGRALLEQAGLLGPEETHPKGGGDDTAGKAGKHKGAKGTKATKR